MKQFKSQFPCLNYCIIIPIRTSLVRTTNKKGNMQDLVNKRPVVWSTMFCDHSFPITIQVIWKLVHMYDYFLPNRKQKSLI